MTEPMPCPFCFGSGLRAVPYGLPASVPLVADGDLTISQTGEDWYCVRCTCSVMGPRVKATKAKACEKAITAWNRRTL